MARPSCVNVFVHTREREKDMDAENTGELAKYWKTDGWRLWCRTCLRICCGYYSLTVVMDCEIIK